MTDGVRWRPEIDALVFSVEDHAAFCAVHRRAFRTLLRFEPSPDECLSYFAGFEVAFRAAAGDKIAKKELPVGRNFHLTSRDIARKLVESETKQGEQ
ncbi:hypothetical protein [Bradyrhizobium sp. Tv2a-2]|uniref:hypothetical protein n=1 Tax=Bradyrhizobium sp. Tv2a-2 TaxID=113395 RepID=UPI0004051493|nr:hypothetical protein [Bradyrhizobium sp. Tv2a-2]